MACHVILPTCELLSLRSLQLFGGDFSTFTCQGHDRHDRGILQPTAAERFLHYPEYQ